MAEHKIVFTDYYYANNDREREILGRLGEVQIVDCTKLVPGGVKQEDEVVRHAADADALIVQFARISSKVIDALTRCRIISRYAIGVDTIDVQAAKTRGIVVANVPDYCIEEVSDTALAHIFNCLRKVTLAHELLHASNWSYDRIRPLRRISSLTVGLVAFGHIARRLAEKLRPFGARILAFDPYFVDFESYPWVESTSLEELLARADVISLHAPHTPETHHLIDRERLACAKEGVVLINTSRGALIDEQALAQDLEVLDCPDGEYANSVLMRFPERVFVTPHISWYSEESIQDLQRKTALNVYEMLAHGKPLYSV
jgi:D-3-phosphoglycerate dehydrogenase